MKTKKRREDGVDVVMFRRLGFSNIDYSYIVSYGFCDPHEIYNYTKKRLITNWKVNGHFLIKDSNLYEM